MIFLQVIYLQCEQLSSIDGCAFHGLDLRSLNIISEESIAIPSLQFVGQNLHQLGVNCFHLCPISFSHETFKGCKMVVKITLLACNLVSVPNLEHVSNTLEILYLVNNNITSLSSMYHINFMELKILNLYDNHLCQVNTRLLHFPKISYINLGSNLLLHIDLHFGNWGPGQTDISLPENTWNCSENWDWLADGCLHNETGQYTWKSSRNSSKLFLEGLDKLSCRYPEKQRGEKCIPHTILKSYIVSPCFGNESFGVANHQLYLSIIIMLVASSLNFKNIIWNTQSIMTNAIKYDV